MLHYILQTIFFQLCFLLIYELLLKKETFFNYNRWYLLLTPVIALLLPLLKLEFLAEAVPNTNIMLPAVVIGGEPAAEILPAVNLSTEEGANINWWLVIYSIGLVASCGLFLKKAYNLNRLFRFRKTSEEKGFRIIEIPNSKLACTFFNTIFLGDQLSEGEKQQILSHELVHVKQKHSLDLMFFELLKIVFWFNPLIYIYQSRIAGLHEFIADQEVVKATGKKNYYEQLLNTAFNTQNISFINQFFNHSLIKKRIVMLQKSKSTTVSKFKFLVIIPLMTLMLTYVACSEEKASAEIPSQQVEKGVLYLEVNDIENLTSEESQKMKEAITKASGNPGYNIVEITDGDKLVRWHENPDKSEANITMERNSGNSESSNLTNEGDVPYAVIDEVPAFPGCEDISSNEERKECTSQKITEFVSEKFDSSMGKKLGLTGVNRVIVQFKIDKNGNIQDVKSRAAAPELEDEAERVINSLPSMTPGKQNGRPVGVMYSLPIVFQVNE
ncbi:M56 family metallopeptidase [Salegentibacter sp. F188]|uniref:M56 family metallopeptidase n=1 Tax=Autumnicola patrickiae TaxID=3075591 RepID=A0ABU3E583_9FLAO|nr:M56 family metallopeptidase [Salegentibacter sp. F188]MDT0691095.1 M56 family metallopeptidase [Salegentibacter sp. F188]